MVTTKPPEPAFSMEAAPDLLDPLAVVAAAEPAL